VARRGARALNPRGASALGPCLLYLSLLRHLSLKLNNVLADGARILVTYVAFLTNLHHLNLEGNKIGPEGVTALGHSTCRPHVPAGALLWL
jgi:hypothetical protein